MPTSRISKSFQNQSQPAVLGQTSDQSLVPKEVGEYFINLLADDKRKASSPFSELVPLAKTLNSESDDLNETIARLNEKLAALNLGCEVWVKHEEDVWYGFCRLSDGWELAQKWKDVDFNGKKRDGYEGVIKASRADRIECLTHISEIILLLKDKAKENIDHIRKAKELAASL